jgi:predicted nucleic acid-binding protein
VKGLIVVADTTPLRYLVVIEREHLLRLLYGRVLIPPAVAEELSHTSTRGVVRTWFAARPSWLEIHQPTQRSNPKWIWTTVSDKRSLWPRKLPPISCW